MADQYRPKFRMWHTTQGLMKVLELHGGVPTIALDKAGNMIPFLSAGPNPDIELSQWSGLADQAGFPVYEGDLVKMNGTYRTGQIGVVIFYLGAFRIKYALANEYDQYIDLLSGLSKELTVIGTKWTHNMDGIRKPE